MTNPEFLCRSGLGESDSKLVVQEVRIIAKSICPERLVDDPSANLAAKSSERLSRFGQRDYAHVARGAVGDAAQSFDQEAIVFLVAGVFARKTRGPNSRSAAQSVNLQPGILREQQSSSVTAI